MHFSDMGLDKRIIQMLAHKDFNQATPIQQAAIPVAMAGRDMMAQSKTGSGKTLAYLIPLMQRLIRSRPLMKKDSRAVVLAPTRELAKQIFAEVKMFTASGSEKPCLLLGGENFNEQAKVLRKDPAIIVATPGRLADHLEKKHLFLNGSEILILDEADRMLDLGFKQALMTIHKNANHRKRQTLMFSATLEHSELSEFAKELLNNPKIVTIERASAEHIDIEQRFYFADNLTHKEAMLDKVLSQSSDAIRQGIIFTATREDTTRIAELLISKGIEATAINGKLLQSQRNQIIDAFAKERSTWLVATDLAARGLDITSVSHVINFDVPKHSEEYVHRIGRTGRAGNKGEAITFVGPKDWQNFKLLELFLQKPITVKPYPELEAQFKGLRNKPSTPTVAKKSTETSHTASKAKAKRAPTARAKRFYEGEDIGMAPIKRSKKPLLDSDEEE